MTGLSSALAGRDDMAGLAAQVSPVGLMQLVFRGTGKAPDEWQLRAMQASVPPPGAGPPRVAITAARQTGKSETASIRVAWEMAYRPGSTTLVVSASERQAAVIADRVWDALAFVGEPARGAQRTQRQITLPQTGSRCVVLPSSSSSLRGWTSTLLLIDEAAFVPDDAIYTVSATTVATGGGIIAISSAGFPTGFFWQVMTDPDRFPEWSRFKVTAYDVARIGADVIEQARRSMTPDAFAREFLSEFVGSAAGYYEHSQIAAACATGDDVDFLSQYTPRRAS